MNRAFGRMLLPIAVGTAVAAFNLLADASDISPDRDEGWTTATPRDEIKPAFDRGVGPRGYRALTIEHDNREGLDGCWTKTYPIVGGTWYQFHCLRKAENVAVPRRSCLVRVLWTDDQGRKVRRDAPPGRGYAPEVAGSAEAEHPQDGAIDAAGWTTVSGTFQAPKLATRAVVELHLQWAPGGKATYSEMELSETTAPAARVVRLATVHFQPREGKTPAEKCRLFEPLIAEAAKQRADLVVLPETLTYYGTSLKPDEVAEPVPGPSTDYFSALAKRHDLYIVAGLYERADKLVYNVAVLLGPDGTIVGKYRKVCLPRDEVAAGVAAGDEYPVFETRFGKVGLMVCYDGFFPEVARRLSNNGAEVIAWPVWGCNPLLGAARACENHVYVISSTYTEPGRDWMLSAVYDHTGTPLVQGKKWGTVVTAEVDLAKPLNWNSLGDFRAHMTRHRPTSDPAADK